MYMNLKSFENNNSNFVYTSKLCWLVILFGMIDVALELYGEDVASTSIAQKAASLLVKKRQGIVAIGQNVVEEEIFHPRDRL